VDLYGRFRDVRYISISHAQGRAERPLRTHTIHHGIRLEHYRFLPDKQAYLSFLGRMVPVKGAHAAIQVARAAGIPLKLAGEVQPMFRDYWDTEIAPHIDGRFFEYLGEADHALKNELLGNSMACLFPIEWNEPFGLVMIEAMACGTPVLALPGGAVEEIVQNDVNGWVCHDVPELARKARELAIDPRACRRDVEERFSVSRMAQAYERVYYEAIADWPTRRDAA
jgi:glycosyltransferase involved in cell wall biosynthesis